MSQQKEGRDISDSEDLTKSIRDQIAQVRRLREKGAAHYEIRPARKQLDVMLREAIIGEEARVRRLRTDRADQSVIAEAERRLEALLTTNEVRRNEDLKEMRSLLKRSLRRLREMLERCKGLRLRALRRLNGNLTDLINMLKSKNSSKFELMENANDLLRALAKAVKDLEKDPNVNKETKSKARGLVLWLIQNLPYIRKIFNKLCSIHEKAIIEQGARLRSLRTDRASRKELEMAEQKLESLKAEFLADTGEESSEVREEGPILLASNALSGNVALPELKARTKDLRRENIVR